MKKPSKKKNTVKDFKHFNPSSGPIIPAKREVAREAPTLSLKQADITMPEQREMVFLCGTRLYDEVADILAKLSR